MPIRGWARLGGLHRGGNVAPVVLDSIAEGGKNDSNVHKDVQGILMSHLVGQRFLRILPAALPQITCYGFGGGRSFGEREISGR